MSNQEVELRDAEVSSVTEKRRRSVHFDSSDTTVIVPGENEEGDLRGRGTGHFTDHEKALIDKEMPSLGLKNSISDETAEQVRFRKNSVDKSFQKNRRKSDSILENEIGNYCKTKSYHLGIDSCIRVFELDSK